MHSGHLLSRTGQRAALALGAASIACFALAASATDVQAGGRPEGAWCATFSGDYGLVDCSYATYAQCHATVFGPGGYCSQNPRVVVLDEGAPLPRRVRRHR